MFIEYFNALIASYFQSGMGEYWFFLAFCLAFVATVPMIVRKFFIWG